MEKPETWRLRRLALVILNIAALIVRRGLEPGNAYGWCWVAFHWNHWERSSRHPSWQRDSAWDSISTECGWLNSFVAWQFDCWRRSYHMSCCRVHHCVCSSRSSIPWGRYSIYKVDFPSHRYSDLKGEQRWRRKSMLIQSFGSRMRSMFM